MTFGHPWSVSAWSLFFFVRAVFVVVASTVLVVCCLRCVDSGLFRDTCLSVYGFFGSSLPRNI